MITTLTPDSIASLASEIDSSISITKVVKKSKTILLSSSGTLSDYRDELNDIAEKYGIDDVDGMEIYYISEDYGISDGGLGVDVMADYTKSEKEIINETAKRFGDKMFRSLYDSLTVSGYKRVGFNSSLLKPFDDTNPYKMYLDKEFDRLFDYYSL